MYGRQDGFQGLSKTQVTGDDGRLQGRPKIKRGDYNQLHTGRIILHESRDRQDKKRLVRQIGLNGPGWMIQVNTARPELWLNRRRIRCWE